MTWHPALSLLRDTFAQLYPRRADAERVVADAGLNSTLISFEDRPVNTWHSIFEEAGNQGRVDALLDEALQSYPNNESLRAAIDAYHNAVAQSNEARPLTKQPFEQESGVSSLALPQVQPSIEGRYYIYGKNADGTGYGGEATVTRKGEFYEIVWVVGEDQYTGLASLKDNILTSDVWSARYEVQPDGILDGRWGTDAIEVLTPMRFLSPTPNDGLPPVPVTVSQTPHAVAQAAPYFAANKTGFSGLNEAAARQELVRLRRLIVERLSDEDLRDLCFELGIDYDDLGGEGRAAKARELLEYCARRDRLADLIAAGKLLRPDVPWG